MSMHATIVKPAPGYMYNIDIYREDGRRMPSYSTVRYTLWGARWAAKRILMRAERDRTAKVYREDVRL